MPESRIRESRTYGLKRRGLETEHRLPRQSPTLLSPGEKSSGKSQRRRLNRGGDRQANAALHRIVVTRMRQDERTRLYLERRTAEGKGKREVMRCLKRYTAREVYCLIRADMITRHQPPDTSATLMTAA